MHNTGEEGGRKRTWNGHPTALLIPAPLQVNVEDRQDQCRAPFEKPTRTLGFQKHHFTNSIFFFKAHNTAQRSPGDVVMSRLSSGKWGQETLHFINFIYSSCGKKDLRGDKILYGDAGLFEIKGTSNILAVACARQRLIVSQCVLGPREGGGGGAYLTDTAQ